MTGDEGLEAIRLKFERRCREDVAALDCVLIASSDAVEEQWRQRVHKLAGMAGSLGYEALSEAAIKLNNAYAVDQTVRESQLIDFKALLQATASRRSADDSVGDSRP